MDVWQPAKESPRVACPNTYLVHDKLHVSNYTREAGDKFRRQENRILIKENLKIETDRSKKESLRNFWERKSIEHARVSSVAGNHCAQAVNRYRLSKQRQCSNAIFKESSRTKRTKQIIPRTYFSKAGFNRPKASLKILETLRELYHESFFFSED
jgi:transposase